jgi:flagella synthesis protein FlgN
MATPTPLEPLLEVLTAELDRANRMLEVLRLEREALRTRDLGAMERAAAEKQHLIGQMESLAHRHESVLRAAGLGPSVLEDRAALARHGLQPAGSAWDTLRGVLAQCRQQNLVNGGVIEMSQRFARDLLTTLRGGSPGTVLYGRSGRTHHSEEGETLASA